MRIPSTKTDQYIYFVAVDATDYVTRETGLATWTVYRSRKGAAEVIYTTPTITEIDATNMPGVYALLVDEDTTIDSGSDSEEYAVHITHAGMAPVTRTIELYRRSFTTGVTVTAANGAADADLERIQGTLVSTPATAGILDVNVKNIDNDAASASGTVTFPNATLASTTNITAGTVTTATNVTTVNGLAANVITAASIATGAIDADAIADNAIDAGAIAADAITAAKIADGAIDAATFATGAITAAAIAADAIGASELAADAVAEIADAVWDEDATAHQTLGTFGKAIGDPGADTDTIWALVNANLDATVSSRATQTSVDTVDDFLDTEIAAIKAKTDNLPSDPADASDIAASFTTVNTKLDVIDDFVDTEVAAIKAKTDQLTFTTANRVDSQVFGMEAGTVTAAAIATGAIDADAIAADAIGASELAADAITEIQSGLATAASIAALNNLSAAQVNAEVLDVLNVDTFAEPTGVPAATVTLAGKIGRLHQALRNKVEVTADEKRFYDDAGAELWKKDLADNGVTYSETEGTTP